MAVGLCRDPGRLPFILKLFGLDHYLRPQRPEPVATVDDWGALTGRGYAATGETTRTTSGGTATATALPGAALSAVPLRPLRSELARSIRIETLYHAEFTSRGARLLSVELLRYASAHGASSHDGRRSGRPRASRAARRPVLGGGPSFSLDLGSGSARMPLDELVYAVTESLDAAGQVRRLTFTAQDSSGMHIRQTWHAPRELRARPRGRDPARAAPVAALRLLARHPLAALQRSRSGGGRPGAACHQPGRDQPPPREDRRAQEGHQAFRRSAQWAAVQTRYFMGAVVAIEANAKATEARTALRPLTPEQRALLPANAPAEQDMVVSALVVGLPGETSPVNRFLVYFGPNEYFKVAGLGVQLERVVDLGWSWIAPSAACCFGCWCGSTAWCATTASPSWCSRPWCACCSIRST